MSRINIPALDAVPAPARPALDALGKQIGFVPNMFRAIAISPPVLAGLGGLSAALSKTLDVKMRERIALAVSEANGCHYCLAAHSYVGTAMAKLTPDEIALNRQGSSSDPKAGAGVRFALEVLNSRGRVSDAAVAAVKDAGFTEAQVLEIVAVTAHNIANNLINNVVLPEIDFPEPHAAAAADGSGAAPPLARPE